MLGGSVLAGPKDAIDEALVWRRRYGGDLFHLYPLAAVALPGLEGLSERMPQFPAHARAIASALSDVRGVTVVPDPPQTPLSDVRGVTVVPDPPQTPLFHIHLNGEPRELRERALALARDQRVWLCNRPEPSVAPAGFQ